MNSGEIGNKPIDQKASGHGKQKLNLISDFFPVFLSAKQVNATLIKLLFRVRMQLPLLGL